MDSTLASQFNQEFADIVAQNKVGQDFDPDWGEDLRFLKAALLYLGDESDDEIIGNFELESRGIKYNGYFVDEENKQFHLLTLIYSDNFSEQLNKEVLEKAREGAKHFFALGLSSKRNDSLSDEIGIAEHIRHFKECVQEGYSLYWDIYSNVHIGDKLADNIAVCNKNVLVSIYDILRIHEAVNDQDSSDLTVDFAQEFDGATLKAILVAENNNFDVYLTSISGELLAKVYDQHKQRILDGNVRGYLKRTQKTNKGISQTAQTTPNCFVAYNNGISAVAAKQDESGKNTSLILNKGDGLFIIKRLYNLQIVNGGQTTVTLYQCWKEGKVSLKDVVVPIKLTILKNEASKVDMESNIAVYANTQTAILKSDLSSNKPFYKNLEKAVANLPIAKENGKVYYWFFERANGLYNTRWRIINDSRKSFVNEHPAKNKFSKTKLAKAIMAYEQMPDVVCLGNEKCFSDYDKLIEKNQCEASRDYAKSGIAVLILWIEADKIIGKAKLPIKAAVLPYTIAALSYLTRKRLNLNGIFSNQKLSKEQADCILDIANQVNDYFQDVLPAHPNTLMWGRKAACWNEIKNRISSPASIFAFANLKTGGYDFFEESPSLKWIKDFHNMNNPFLWSDLHLFMNRNPGVFAKQDMDAILKIESDLGFGLNICKSSNEEKAINLYLKAALNGFHYQE